MQGISKNTKATSSALAGKTARACESCLKRRARWYCASDDAFLCHTCDNSVHLANKLASRHKRVRLETSSFKNTPSNPNFNSPISLSPSNLPPWRGGFTRKARTPRNCSNPFMKKFHNLKNNPVVPEIESDNEGDDEVCGSLMKICNEDDDQLIFSVPVFDPFEITSDVDHQNEFCENSKVFGGGSGSDGLDFDISLIGFDDGCDKLGADDDDENNWDNLPVFLPSDAELAEFAADVESLLIDDDHQLGAKGILPLLDDDHNKVETLGMKIENDYLGESIKKIGTISSCWGLGFDIKCDEEKPRRSLEGKVISEIDKSKICLRLDYDAVISAWPASKGSPWTSGCRPKFDSVDVWPHFMQGGVGPSVVENENGEVGAGGHVLGGDGGRCARVLRYREKRKNRLFSKKIRYQVRKLNAEKRPRLKGRFVKRTNSSPSSSSSMGLQTNFPYFNFKV